MHTLGSLKAQQWLKAQLVHARGARIPSVPQVGSSYISSPSVAVRPSVAARKTKHCRCSSERLPEQTVALVARTQPLCAAENWVQGSSHLFKAWAHPTSLRCPQTGRHTAVCTSRLEALLISIGLRLIVTCLLASIPDARRSQPRPVGDSSTSRRCPSVRLRRCPVRGPQL